ncbi:MAG TPA: DUF3108 domain-containing protein [Kofleriaceae bacterium]|nr:DUF3108 domain-containing protein [Kofleriaceae bacterium]
MLRLFTTLSLVLVAGCGPKTTSPTPTAPPDPSAPAASFPQGPPLVTPGERMTYRVELRGIQLAQMTVAVGDTTDVGGKRGIVMQAHAQSVGLVNMLAAIDDTFTSWIDVETGRSLRFQVDEYQTNSKTNVEHTVIDLAGREGDMLPIQFRLNDETPKDEPQKVSEPEVWDWNSFLVMLRAWEGPPGTSRDLQIFRSRYLWNVKVTIGPTQKITTELGDLPALRFDAHTYKYTRELTKAPGNDERDFSVWISDDADRVPLQLQAQTDYGPVTMRIVDYQPGTGTRLRP